MLFIHFPAHGQSSYSHLLALVNDAMTRLQQWSTWRQSYFIRNPTTLSIHILLLLSRFSRARLCDPIDSSPPGSPVSGILQARTLEWVAISFSNAWKWKVKGSGSVVSSSSWPHGRQPTRLLHPWDFPGKSTGVSCHCLFHSIHITSKQIWIQYFTNCIFYLVKDHS